MARRRPFFPEIAPPQPVTRSYPQPSLRRAAQPGAGESSPSGSRDGRRPTPLRATSPALDPAGQRRGPELFFRPEGTFKLKLGSRTVRASAGQCVGPGLAGEPSAALHPRSGLNGARGFPRGQGADSRAPWRCVVSASPVAGSAPLRVLTPPRRLFFKLLAMGMLRGGHPCAEPGGRPAEPRWLRPSGFPGRRVLKSRSRALRSSLGHGVGSEPPDLGQGRAVSEMAQRMGHLSLVSDLQS